MSGFVAELDVDHAVGVLIRIGVKKDGVDDAENGGGGADAEGKRQDGGENKARRLAELAEGEANVLQQVLHRASPERKALKVIRERGVRCSSKSSDGEEGGRLDTRREEMFPSI
jgi:hypothetical protein